MKWKRNKSTGGFIAEPRVGVHLHAIPVKCEGCKQLVPGKWRYSVETFGGTADSWDCPESGPAHSESSAKAFAELYYNSMER